MPEILEVEQYRSAAEAVVGRGILEVWAPDPWYCKGGIDPSVVVAACTGATVGGVRRHGKLLLLDLDDVVLGLRFGMTGRLLVDGDGPIERLEYSSARHDAAWERFGLRFDDGGSLVVHDPRRLGGVELDPDLARLGPDALSIRANDLAVALRGQAPLKAALLAQDRVAGLGNLLTDEVLWRVGLDPARAASSLSAEDRTALAATIRSTLRQLERRGGSHRGDLQAQRHRGGSCPRDGAVLLRRRIGGRTTYSCPAHQR